MDPTRGSFLSPNCVSTRVILSDQLRNDKNKEKKNHRCANYLSGVIATEETLRAAKVTSCIVIMLLRCYLHKSRSPVVRLFECIRIHVYSSVVSRCGNCTVSLSTIVQHNFTKFVMFSLRFICN